MKGAIAPPAITLFLPETVEYFQTLPDIHRSLRSLRESGRNRASSKKLTDPQIVRLSQTRANAGAEVGVIGHFSKRDSGIQAVQLAGNHPGRAPGSLRGDRV